MPKLRVSYAGHLSDRVQDLYWGRVRPDGIDMQFVPLSPLEAFRRVSSGEFHAGEMSLSAYLINKARGDNRFVAIPVFPSRAFRHRAIYVNRQAHIETPQDLVGRKVGVPEYQMTAAVWVRGLLQHEYGVLPETLSWFMGGLSSAGREPLVVVDVAGVSLSHVSDRSLDDLLVSREIDAVIAPQAPPSFQTGHPDIGRLFSDHRAVETDYYKRTGLFPIMHTVVLKRELYEQASWVASSLFQAFDLAKQNCLHNLALKEPLPVSLPWIDSEVEAAQELFGQDLWPYGIQPNRDVIDAACRYVHEQGLGERLQVDDLFVPDAMEWRGAAQS